MFSMNDERDKLTGLHSRVNGLAQLGQALAEAKQQGEIAAVLFTDIDRFKTLNCNLGHVAGDVVLRQLADRVQRVVADKGMVCRFGSDKFFVVLPSASASEEIAEQICEQAANQPVELEGQVVYVIMTIGIASYPVNGQDAESLLRAAEEAVSQGKAVRRGTVYLARKAPTTG